MDLPILNMMNMDMLIRIVAAIAVIGLVDTLIRVCDALILKPKRLQSKLVKQGIRGPPASFLIGNSREVKAYRPEHEPKPYGDGQQGKIILHDYAASIYPCFQKWTKAYGIFFSFFFLHFLSL